MRKSTKKTGCNCSFIAHFYVLLWILLLLLLLLLLYCSFWIGRTTTKKKTHNGIDTHLHKSMGTVLFLMFEIRVLSVSLSLSAFPPLDFQKGSKFLSSIKEISRCAIELALTTMNLGLK